MTLSVESSGKLDPVSVRDENRQRTRAALANAAMELFTEHGYEHVTMAEVAAAAGVSRRTAFRHFGSKDELVLEYPDQWMAVFDQSLAEHCDSDIVERLRLAAHAVVEHIDQDAEGVRKAFNLAFSHPDLAARYAASNQVWVERVAQEIEPDDNVEAAAMIRSKIWASAYMGMINGVCEVWAATGTPMAPLIDESFDMVSAAEG